MKTHYVSGYRAAKTLGIEVATVRKWVESGRLKGLVRRRKVWRVTVLVESSALRNPKALYMVKCAWCGHLFRADYPERKKYCCRRHFELANYARRKRLKK